VLSLDLATTVAFDLGEVDRGCHFVPPHVDCCSSV
jgi:hypothetical protein